MQMFAIFSSEQEHFTHDMYITAIIRPLDVRKSNRSCSMKERCQSFRRSSAFVIAVVVTSRSSSFEYTMSVHAVHAGAERKVYYIVVSTETPPNHHQSISNAAPRVQSSTLIPAPLKVLTSETPTVFSSAFCAD